MDLRIWEQGGFVADGEPTIARPDNWIVWHFTLLDYLPEIIADDALCCDDDVPEHGGSVANQSVKALRRTQLVAANGYPLGRTVSSHVPFYFAAKSPMLYVVRKNFPPATLDSLIFLGVRVRDAIAEGVEWVASDGNASAGVTQFTTDLANLGTFVDFNLLKARDWYDTADDPHRKHRRAAEFLVHERVPLSAVSHVWGKNEETLEAAHHELSSAGYTSIEYNLTDVFFN